MTLDELQLFIPPRMGYSNLVELLVKVLDGWRILHVPHLGVLQGLHHKKVERPLPSHALEHNFTSLEEGFTLKAIYLEKQRPEDSKHIIDMKLRNVEIAH